MKPPVPRVDTESWLPLPGSPLEVSNRGNVRSTAWGKTKPHKLQVQYGHPYVYWLAGGKLTGRRVAVLVLELFCGARPPGCAPAYADGDTTNCRTTNLSWAPREARGRGYGKGLPAVDVEAIRRLCELGRREAPGERYWTQRRIAERMRVSLVTVWRYGATPEASAPR